MARTHRLYSIVIASVLFAGLAESARGQQPAYLRVKLSTVYIKVTDDDGGVASGSGFFAFEPGVVVTNAHVLGMLEANAKPPTKIEVFVNSGEANEMQLTGKILGVDRSADLAVLRVEGKPLPVPLILNAAKLFETQPVYIFGFPLGEKIGKEISVTQSTVASLRNDERGNLNRIQVNGGMHHGNSGGPVVNAFGQVVGVAVAGIEGTQINFAIPAAKVQETMKGRVREVGKGVMFRQGEEVRVPLQFKCLDPLKKIQDFRVDVWAGNPSSKRAFLPTKAQPLPGDGPRQTIPMKYADDATSAEILLPKLTPGQVAWVQPVLVYGKGEARWGKPESFDVAEAVERQPASFVVKQTDQQQRTVHLKTSESYAVTRGNDSLEFSRSAELDILEALSVNSRGALVRTGFTVPKLAQFDGEKKGKLAPEIDTMLPKMAPIFLVDSTNLFRKRIDLGTKFTISKDQSEDLAFFFGLVCFGLQTTSFALPNKEVQARDTWQSRTPMRLKRTGLGNEEAQLHLVATCTFEGWRTTSGKREALVSFAGKITSATAKKYVAGQGTVAGTFTFDPERGFITRAKLKMDPELPEEFENLSAKINVDLTRAEGNPKNIEPPEVDADKLKEAESLTLSDVEPMLKKLAGVKVENANFLSIKSAKDGGKKIFGEVPAWLKERTFHFNDKKTGVTQLTVETDGVVLMSISPRFRQGQSASASTGGVFGGIKEPWYWECKSRRELVQERWIQCGTLPILSLAWPLYYRECKSGESFEVRVEKDLAPIIIK